MDALAAISAAPLALSRRVGDGHAAATLPATVKTADVDNPNESVTASVTELGAAKQDGEVHTTSLDPAAVDGDVPPCPGA
jgi:hypothetical protein